MRAYTVATVAVTLGVTPKWLDNALTRFPIRGVIQSRQGVSRRLAPQAVVTLHLASQLIRTLGLSLAQAVLIAERAGEEPETASIELFESTRLVVDVSAAASDVSARLAHAVEVTPVPKRGRPSAK